MRTQAEGPRWTRRLALSLLLLVWAQPASALFRFDEVDPRDFSYNSDYFINILSYRTRLTYRWAFRTAGVGYSITAGSLRNDELYLDQRAVVRLPFSSHISAEYRFVEWEDYDARYQRNEVELLLRFFRPAWAPGLLERPGRVSPWPDGLFFGGTGLLDADKEFADIGLALGWGNEFATLRLDVIHPDLFYNDKNGEDAQYDREPYTLRARADLRLLEGDVLISGWVEDDLPLELSLPLRDQLSFRYAKLQAGVELRWRVSHRLRCDLEAWGELTRKAHRSPTVAATNQDLRREAFRLYAQAELDVAPLLGQRSSRAADTWLFGAHVHLLDEVVDPLFSGPDATLARSEAYLELGYVLGIPSPGPEYGFALRAAAHGGYLAEREVDPGKHSVNQRFLAKLSAGFEVSFLNDLLMAFGQLTFRLDNQTFGGANVQVTMTF